MNKPSVTKLIGMLDKPALMKWANKIGLKGIHLDDYKSKSLSNGRDIHSQIEQYILKGTSFNDIEVENSFKKLFKDKEIIAIEKPIDCEYFQGRLDIKFKWNDNIYIADFKSNQTNVYFENKLQLSAYKLADGCDFVGIISVPDFKFMFVDIKDYEPYYNILKSLSTIYTLRKSVDSYFK